MAEIAGALVGLVGAGLQASAQAEQQTIELMNLRFQQRMAADNMRFAQATRTDAYGNKQRYNEATNTWETDLTPTQRAIVGAGEQEQLKKLTEDATRNRLILEEQRQRGLAAIPDYNKALAGFRYDQAPSRGADENQLYTLMSLASQDVMGGDRQAIGRTLLRQGRGADYALAIKAMDDAQGQSVGPNLLRAYEQSIPQFAQDVQQRQQHYLPLLDALQRTMAGGASSAPSPYSTVPNELNAIEGQQAAAIQSAFTSGASGVGGAFNELAKAAGQSPNLSGVASALSGLGKGGGGKSQQPQYGLVPNQNAYDPGVGYTDPGSGGGNLAPYLAPLYDPNLGFASPDQRASLDGGWGDYSGSGDGWSSFA
jgi:hypothetical protein